MSSKSTLSKSLIVTSVIALVYGAPQANAFSLSDEGTQTSIISPCKNDIQIMATDSICPTGTVYDSTTCGCKQCPIPFCASGYSFVQQSGTCGTCEPICPLDTIAVKCVEGYAWSNEDCECKRLPYECPYLISAITFDSATGTYPIKKLCPWELEPIPVPGPIDPYPLSPEQCKALIKDPTIALATDGGDTQEMALQALRSAAECTFTGVGTSPDVLNPQEPTFSGDLQVELAALEAELLAVKAKLRKSHECIARKVYKRVSTKSRRELLECLK